MSKYQKLASCLVATAVLAVASQARAGMFQTINCGANGPNCSFASNIDVNGVGWGTYTNTNFTAPAGYNVSGTTVTVGTDPHMNIFEDITNNSGSPWVSYEVTINPGIGTVSNLVGNIVTPFNPAWDLFSTATPSGGNSLAYSGGMVNPGQTLELWFAFDVTDNNGSYSYQVINFPASGSEAPEPASLGLLAVGGLMLLKRRR